MRNRFSIYAVASLIGLSACGGPGEASHLAPPVLAAPADMASPVPPARPCAQPADGGSYRDELHKTACHFEALNGIQVCVPDNMPRIIGGVCDPAGGPDRIWLDRNPDCNEGTSLYAITRPSRVCGNLTGLIQKVSPQPAADQRIFIYDPGTKSCTPSGYSARSEAPIYDRAPPPDPVFLSEKELPTTECK